MLDHAAHRAMDELLKQGGALIDALNLAPVEREHAMAESQQIINLIPERYFAAKLMGTKQVRPIAVAAAVAFSLAYFGKWVTEIERNRPELRKR